MDPLRKESVLEGAVLPGGVRVKEVLDRWYGSDCRYVKVLGEEGEVYILRRGAIEVRWKVVFYEAPNYRERGCTRSPVM